MPTTTLPPEKEKAAEISRKIANTRQSTRDKASPESNVTGGFNQTAGQELTDRSAEDKAHEK